MFCVKCDAMLDKEETLLQQEGKRRTKISKQWARNVSLPPPINWRRLFKYCNYFFLIFTSNNAPWTASTILFDLTTHYHFSLILLFVWGIQIFRYPLIDKHL